jgi:hypothetical protein
MVYKKTFSVMNTRMESKDIIVLELSDETSPPVPGAIRTAVIRIAPSDYADPNGLNNLPLNTKVELTLSIVARAASAQTSEKTSGLQ